MLTSEFLRKKNEIVFKETGLILVPEDQIVDIDVPEIGTFLCCPYCEAYQAYDC